MALQIVHTNFDEDLLMLPLSQSDHDGYNFQHFSWAYSMGFTPYAKM